MSGPSQLLRAAPPPRDAEPVGPADAEREERHSPLRTLAGVLVSVAALAAVGIWASGQEAPRFPSGAGAWSLLLLAIALYAVATLARGWRWDHILRHAGVGHDARDAYALVPVGYMGNTVLPARGGEVMRIVLLARRSGARRREVLGTVLSERTLDAVSLALLFVALAVAGIEDTSLGRTAAPLAAAALVVGALALAGYLALRRRGHFERFAALVRPVIGSAKPLLGRAGAVLLAATLAVWLLEGVIFYLVAQSLSLDVGPVDGCMLLVLSAFFSLIPAAPGYVGTFDAAVIFGLHAMSVGGGQAIAFALLVRFVLFVPITLCGLLLLLTRYGGLRRARA
jgi:glycosyltransferase 2 family protein